jgi:hypothetical protein
MESPKRTARIAGFLYLLLGVLSFFGMPPYFIRPGDIARTANHIMASESLFRLSILSADQRQLSFPSNDNYYSLCFKPAFFIDLVYTCLTFVL